MKFSEKMYLWRRAFIIRTDKAVDRVLHHHDVLWLPLIKRT